MASFDQFTRLFTKNLDRAIENTLRSRQFIEFGEGIVTLILRRSRSGFGVNRTQGRQQRLLPLSRDYIEQRQVFQELDSTTSPRKSNLTYTGQMLRSLRHRVTSQGGLNHRILVDFSNNFATEKAEMVSPRRPFLHLTSGDVRRLTRQIRQLLARNLARLRV